MSHQLLAWEVFFWKEGQMYWFSGHFPYYLLVDWMERNRRVFNGVEMLLELLRNNWFKTLFFWEENIFYSSSIDLIDFVVSILLGCKSSVCRMLIQNPLYSFFLININVLLLFSIRKCT